MKNLLLLLLAGSLICFEYASAQVDTLWVQRFNGPAGQDDNAKIIKIDQNGFIYVAGTVFPVSGIKHYGVIKYTPDGDSLWVRYFNSVDGTENELNDMTIDHNNNIIVTGTNFSTGNSDYATVKWDSDGNRLWAKLNDGGDIDFAFAVAVDQSDNVCVTGTSSLPFGGYNYLTIKYSPDGDTLWTHTFAGNENATDIAYAIAVDNTGSIIVSGNTDWQYGTSDIVTIKLNAVGDTVWKRQYNSPENGQDGSTAMAVDSYDNIYIAGVTYANNTDILLIKYNPLGDILWTRKYIGPGNGTDYITSMVADNSGNLYVTGRTYSAGTGIDFLTMKYNSSGVQQWIKTYAGVGSYQDYAESIALDNFGNLYVTGTTEKSSINSDFATIKYDTDGNEKWSITYHGPDDRNDYANSICLDDSGYVYVTGLSGSLSGGFDFATVKYTQTPNSLDPDWLTVPEEYKLHQNYPNPFNASTNIEFRIPKNEFVTLKIFNLLGEEVTTLLSGRLLSGFHNCEFDASDLPSGVYFYRLQAGEYIQISKALLLR